MRAADLNPYRRAHPPWKRITALRAPNPRNLSVTLSIPLALPPRRQVPLFDRRVTLSWVISDGEEEEERETILRYFQAIRLAPSNIHAVGRKLAQTTDRHRPPRENASDKMQSSPTPFVRPCRRNGRSPTAVHILEIKPSFPPRRVSFDPPTNSIVIDLALALFLFIPPPISLYLPVNTWYF